jgi:hypothetical protein
MTHPKTIPSAHFRNEAQAPSPPPASPHGATQLGFGQRRSSAHFHPLGSSRPPVFPKHQANETTCAAQLQAPLSPRFSLPNLGLGHAHLPVAASGSGLPYSTQQPPASGQNGEHDKNEFRPWITELGVNATENDRAQRRIEDANCKLTDIRLEIEQIKSKEGIDGIIDKLNEYINIIEELFTENEKGQLDGFSKQSEHLIAQLEELKHTEHDLASSISVFFQPHLISTTANTGHEPHSFSALETTAARGHKRSREDIQDLFNAPHPARRIGDASTDVCPADHNDAGVFCVSPDVESAVANGPGSRQKPKLNTTEITPNEPAQNSEMPQNISAFNQQIILHCERTSKNNRKNEPTLTPAESRINDILLAAHEANTASRVTTVTLNLLRFMGEHLKTPKNDSEDIHKYNFLSGIAQEIRVLIDKKLAIYN